MSGDKGLGISWLLEVNLHLLPLAEFLAEASHGRSNTQILQFCRVQLVRQRLNIGGYLRNLLLEFAHTAADFGQNERVFVELLQLDSQQGETLTDVVVKLSANPGTFLLLCLNQLAADVCKRGFSQFALGDVDKSDHCPDNLPLSAADTTNIQQGNLFHSLSKTPRPLRGLLPRFVLPGERDTPLRGTVSRPHECDATDHAYSCRALDQCARIPKCGSRQGCRRCIVVRDQSHRSLRRSSRAVVGVYPRSRAAPLPDACARLHRY